MFLSPVPDGNANPRLYSSKQEKWQRDLPSRNNLEIVIDEAPRTSKRLWIEASRNQPRIWTVGETHCPIMKCRFHKPNSIRADSLPSHVETHGLLRQNSKLGISDKVRCPSPGCNSKKSAMDLEQHVLYMRNESNAIPCPHVDCTDSPRRYTPGQAGDHNGNSNGPKTIKCVFTGCENSDMLYNVNGHNYHISTHHVELSCPVPDCGILIHSWTNLRLHLFTLHGVKSTMGNVEAVASSLVNSDYHGHSTTKIRESQENDQGTNVKSNVSCRKKWTFQKSI